MFAVPSIPIRQHQVGFGKLYANACDFAITGVGSNSFQLGRFRLIVVIMHGRSLPKSAPTHNGIPAVLFSTIPLFCFTNWGTQQEAARDVARGTSLRGNGGAEGNRTPDLLIANEALSQLSYSPIPRRAGRCGADPAKSSNVAN